MAVEYQKIPHTDSSGGICEQDESEGEFYESPYAFRINIEIDKIKADRAANEVEKHENIAPLIGVSSRRLATTLWTKTKAAGTARSENIYTEIPKCETMPLSLKSLRSGNRGLPAVFAAGPH